MLGIRMTCEMRFAQHVQRGHPSQIIKLMHQRLAKKLSGQDHGRSDPGRDGRPRRDMS